MLISLILLFESFYDQFYSLKWKSTYFPDWLCVFTNTLCNFIYWFFLIIVYSSKPSSTAFTWFHRIWTFLVGKDLQDYQVELLT